MGETTHEPPGLPEVRDEAADTPLWVPVLGLSLLVLLGLVFVLRAATADEAAPAGPGAGAPQAQAEAAEAPAAVD